MKKIVEKIKGKLSEWWHLLIEWVLSRTVGEIWRIFIGMLVGAFFAIVFASGDAIIPVAVVSIVVELLDLYRGKRFQWQDMIYMLIGVIPIEIMIGLAALC